MTEAKKDVRMVDIQSVWDDEDEPSKVAFVIPAQRIFVSSNYIDFMEEYPCCHCGRSGEAFFGNDSPA